MPAARAADEGCWPVDSAPEVNATGDGLWRRGHNLSPVVSLQQLGQCRPKELHRRALGCQVDVAGLLRDATYPASLARPLDGLHGASEQQSGLVVREVFARRDLKFSRSPSPAMAGRLIPRCRIASLEPGVLLGYGGGGARLASAASGVGVRCPVDGEARAVRSRSGPTGAARLAAGAFAVVGHQATNFQFLPEMMAHTAPCVTPWRAPASDCETPAAQSARISRTSSVLNLARPLRWP